MEKERHDLRENNDLPPGWPSPLNVPSPGPATHSSSSSPSSAKRRSYSCTVWGPRPWNRSVAPWPPGAYLSLTAPEAPRRAHATVIRGRYKLDSTNFRFTEF